METPLPSSAFASEYPMSNADSPLLRLDESMRGSPSACLPTRPKTCVRRPREPSAALNEDRDYLEKLLKDPALRKIPG